uniref:Uncharacterized protein n=1 Tax=Pseudonaja textilis TaxID=8673 RepID=A0A670Z3E7_PSETE
VRKAGRKHSGVAYRNCLSVNPYYILGRTRLPVSVFFPSFAGTLLVWPRPANNMTTKSRPPPKPHPQNWLLKNLNPTPVYIYIYMCVYVCIYIYTYLPTYLSIYLHTYIHTYIHTHKFFF